MVGLFQSLSGAPRRFEGELCGYRDGLLELLSVQSYGVNQPMRLAVDRQEFRIHLVTSRVLPDGRTIGYQAIFREDTDAQAARMRVLWGARREAAAHAGHEMRRRPRLARVFRVRSQALANFRATTRDVSETGVCVACEGPLEPGTEVELTLDLDTVNAPSLKCRSQVVWCRPGGGRTWLVGFRFEELSPHGLVVLRSFLEQVRTMAEDPHRQGPP